jgi:hypothetical protein
METGKVIAVWTDMERGQPIFLLGNRHSGEDGAMVYADFHAGESTQPLTLCAHGR